MGRRGPPPKLKIHAGSQAAKKPPTTKVPSGRPECPAFLKDAAKQEWERIVPELDAAGLLSVIDRGAMSAWCQAFAELEWATIEIEREGRIVKEPIQNSRGEEIGTKLKAHPAVKMQRDAFNRVARFIVEFGLSPATRNRTGGARGEDQATGEGGNPFAALQARVAQARTVRTGSGG